MPHILKYGSRNECMLRTAVERTRDVRGVAAELVVSPRTVGNLLCEEYRGGTRPLCRVGRWQERRRDALLRRVGAGTYARESKRLL